jgi:ABC-type antimicrobial peptide transport system permease subunit
LKEKVAKQLHKNKELLAEVVIEIPTKGVEGYFKRVLDVMNLTLIVGLSWGGEDKNIFDFFFFFSIIDKRELIIGVFTPKFIGMKEFKNIDCSIYLVKCQHQRGFLGLKMYFPFPLMTM